MLIKNHSSNIVTENDVTDYDVFLNRREFLKESLLLGTVLWGAGSLAGAAVPDTKSLAYKKSTAQKTLPLTALAHVSGYNNFYEFGTDKADPARYAQQLVTDPWSIQVSGLVKRSGQITLEDLLKRFPLEERIYRLRCVEAWSMVVPWIGFPLRDLIQWLEPSSNAKYVQFETLHDPKQMPGQLRGTLDWPYVEALRLDEAMHPLTLFAVGLYGNVLPKQNGAPLRLVVPWKYGFKNIKSIVALKFVEKAPVTSWMRAAPSEYGFYANVNPEVDHPRWTQKRERIIGSFGRRTTELFNGYGDEVVGLYKGMDLRREF